MSHFFTLEWALYSVAVLFQQRYRANYKRSIFVPALHCVKQMIGCTMTCMYMHKSHATLTSFSDVKTLVTRVKSHADIQPMLY